MVRETRGSAAREVTVEPSVKRKRSSPAPPSIPLKVVLPSPTSLKQEHEPKRQKISLKLGTKTSRNALGPYVRAALALVIEQMAEDLPPPLNGILSLSLPPKFEKTEENTLGYLLRREDLMWDDLVNILHTFSANLLVPCAYPNPMPSLAHFHLPIPPLPCHYPPHVIYNFCAALHSIMRQLEPAVAVPRVQPWALVQKTSQEWFTSGSVEDPATWDKSGYATAVTLRSAGEPSKVRLVSESLLQRASLKASRWKQVRAARSGGFGSVTRGVIIPPSTSASFTPAFAPTFDSTFSTGGFGYYTTVQAMHERTRHREWNTRTPAAIEQGYWGTPDNLESNASRIVELQAWQDIRIQRGQEQPTEREHQLAHELLVSLTTLAAEATPRDFAVDDAKMALLSVPSPALRGTLDPKRPHAVHDNTTLRGLPWRTESRLAQSSTPSEPTKPASYTRPGPGPSRLSQSFGPMVRYAVQQ